MSIDATLANLGIKRFGDKKLVGIPVQGVPPHIDDKGPEWAFLPRPLIPRARLCGPFSSSNPARRRARRRNGQNYVRPLLMLTGAQYEQAIFRDLVARLEDALDIRYGPGPKAIVFDPDGGEHPIH